MYQNQLLVTGQIIIQLSSHFGERGAVMHIPVNDPTAARS